jgi:putative transcriptional regulator
MSKFDIDTVGNNLIKVDGKIIFKLQSILDKMNITKYKLSKITNIRYDTICNYCKGNVTLLNIEYLKIFCNVLNCKVEDIIEYKK